ncbi:GNAT family N-acetyltransferase [Endozoicomonas atrinae]|uniref:GNAT family N-acetyltransferase n=1 Tax=Endozoicomonas atrinae TaxID=1333660 RepID=UPI003B00DDDA
MTVTIRRLTETDNADVFQLGIQVHVLSKYGKDYHFNPEKVKHLIHLHATHPDYGAWLAIDEQGNAVGALGAYVCPCFFGDDLLAFDEIVFVVPSAQSKGVGKQLISAYLDWAREKGVKAAHIGITAGITEQETTDKILALGFEPWGQLTRKTLED